jgi:hypothetical protein
MLGGLRSEETQMFIITEKHDIGGRDTVYRNLVATESVYGGKPFPGFSKREDAEAFIEQRDDNYRGFEIMELADA